MGVAVTTPMLRFQFVRGQVTSGEPDEGFVACGDGTAFPMEVTGATVREKFDRIAEVMYRVRDAQCVAGSMEVSAYDVSVTLSITGPFVAGELHQYALDDSSGYDSVRESTRGYYVTGAVPDYPASFFDGSHAASEFAIWTTAFNDSWRFKTGFSFQGEAEEYADFCGNDWPTWTDPEIYAPSTAGSGFDAGPCDPDDPPWVNNYWRSGGVSLEFGGQVAVVYGPGETDIFAPANRLFLQMSFTADASGYFSVLQEMFTDVNAAYVEYDPDDPDQTPPVLVESCRIILRLAGDIDVSAQVYHYASDGYGSLDAVTATHWVFEAKQWWPYAHPNGSPVWNATTGARIP